MESNQKDPLHEKRMTWWRKAKFGVFIHWGLYSVLGGEWMGKKPKTPVLRNFSEWVMASLRIPEVEYRKTAEIFNPTDFDPKEWAKTIRESGAKYVVFTAKHHEGFSMFDSEFSDYNVVKATPFKRDVVKELSDAVRSEGLRFGIYYSILDWHFSKKIKPRAVVSDFDAYMRFMKGQLKELLTRYGKISVLFLDGDWIPQWNEERSKELLGFLRGLDADLIINDRVRKRSYLSLIPLFQKFKFGTGLGDYDTAEQFIPGKKHSRDWETEMTMNKSWGYKKDDSHWSSSPKIIDGMARVFANGGNFLLNIGPDSTGNIPRESIDRLKGIGKWFRKG